MGLFSRKTKTPVDRGSHPARSTGSGPDMFDKAEAAHNSPGAKAARQKAYDTHMGRSPEEKWKDSSPSERMTIQSDEEKAAGKYTAAAPKYGPTATTGHVQRSDDENF